MQTAEDQGWDGSKSIKVSQLPLDGSVQSSKFNVQGLVPEDLPPAPCNRVHCTSVSPKVVCLFTKSLQFLYRFAFVAEAFPRADNCSQVFTAQLEVRRTARKSSEEVMHDA